MQRPTPGGAVAEVQRQGCRGKDGDGGGGFYSLERVMEVVGVSSLEVIKKEKQNVQQCQLWGLA